jgi:hypothetical protein
LRPLARVSLCICRTKNYPKFHAAKSSHLSFTARRYLVIMALHVPRAPGFASMLKEGAQFFSGVEEAVLRNIGACKEFSGTLASAYGPNGMNKMVINHLEKLFVTNDAATIIR